LQHEGLDCCCGSGGVRPFFLRAPLREAPLTRCFIGGFKGTWSHTELHALRLRLHGAKLHKARKGALRCNPPTGYVYDPSGVLVLDPDESVVAAIRLLFQQFAAFGSAYGVMRYFAQHQIPFPRRRWMPGTSGALHWGPLGLSRVMPFCITRPMPEPMSMGVDAATR
jgi:hypothetical protein